MVCPHTRFQDPEDRLGPAGRNGSRKKLPHAKGAASRISLRKADGRERKPDAGVHRVCAARVKVPVIK